MGSDLGRTPEVSLRRAVVGDMRRLWEWRNDPDTRRGSLNSEEIPLEHHIRWLGAQLESADVALYIIEAAPDLVPCGQVRLNRLPRGGALVSIGLAKEWRGRGVGPAALRAIRQPGWRPTWARPMYAVIRLENAQSQRAFEAAGFKGPASRGVDSVGDLESGTGVWVEKDI